MTTKRIAKQRDRQHKSLVGSPDRLMRRKQLADLGLIKVINFIARGTHGDVIGGRLGFICAATKQDGVPRTLPNWQSYGQVYDSVTTMALI